MSLNTFSDSEILSRLLMLVQQERELLSEILEHLMIVEDRGIYLSEGYGSLFDYAVRVLNYNESQAYRRIAAMRILRELPELKPSIDAGKINLTQMAGAKKMFKAQALQKSTYSKSEKLNLFTSLENKTTRETEKIFAEILPEAKPRDQERVLTEDLTLIQFAAGEVLMTKLKKFKELDSHKLINPTYAELFERLVDLAIKQKEKVYLPRQNKTSASENVWKN